MHSSDALDLVTLKNGINVWLQSVTNGTGGGMGPYTLSALSNFMIRATTSPLSPTDFQTCSFALWPMHLVVSHQWYLDILISRYQVAGSTNKFNATDESLFQISLIGPMSS